MKPEKSNDFLNYLLTAFIGRLEAEATRFAAQLPGERMPEIVAENPQAIRVFQLERQCPPCRGDGFVEHEQAADVPGYRVVMQRHATLRDLDQVRHVDPPKVTVRERCQRCDGRGVVMTSAAQVLLTNLAQLLRDEVKAAAAAVPGFNEKARAELAAQAKRHEEERARNEQADKLELEAMEKVAAIRAGKAPVEVRK